MKGVLAGISPPAGWQWIPLGRATARSKEIGKPDLPPLSVFLDAGVVPRSERADNFNVLGEDLGKYLVVKLGDLVFNKLRTWQGGLGVSAFEGIVSPAYFVCRPLPDVEPRYLHYLLRSDVYLQELTRVSKWMPPSQFDIGWEQLREVPLLLPPLSRQREITGFLDAETARIDALIERKRQMDALLHARLDALIRDAVTGQLTLANAAAPDAHNRARNVLRWARDPPRHWDVRPLGSVLELRNEGNSPIRTDQVLSLTADRGVIPYEEKGDIGNKASEDISRYHLVYPGDIVLNSMNVIIGSVGLSKYFGALSPVYYVLRQRDPASTDIRYFAYHFRIREFQRQLARLGYGILEHRLRIPWMNLKRETICVPRLSEQVAIADLLDVEARRTESMVAALSRSVGLLAERRQGLITAAVTGQVDLPEAV